MGRKFQHISYWDSKIVLERIGLSIATTHWNFPICKRSKVTNYEPKDDDKFNIEVV